MVCPFNRCQVQLRACSVLLVLNFIMLAIAIAIPIAIGLAIPLGVDAGQSLCLVFRCQVIRIFLLIDKRPQLRLGPFVYRGRQ